MGGRGKENYKFLPHSPEGRENRARKKIAPEPEQSSVRGKHRRGGWAHSTGSV